MKYPSCRKYRPAHTADVDVGLAVGKWKIQSTEKIHIVRKVECLLRGHGEVRGIIWWIPFAY